MPVKIRFSDDDVYRNRFNRKLNHIYIEQRFYLIIKTSPIKKKFLSNKLYEKRIHYLVCVEFALGK